MFFIGIFGIEDNEKAIKDFSGVICPQCGRLSAASFFERYRYFHIFFIPTFKWNRRYFIKLRCCGALYEADAEYAQQLRTADQIDFSRLRKASSGFGRFDDMFATCPRCGKSFDSSFTYCPYCGAKR